MNSYDSFASHYDAVVGDRQEVARFLRALLKRYMPRARSLLELGCGSGSMLELLTKSYRCTGIDLSPGMIKVAKRKAPRARLMVGDITEFSLSERFDAILCPFDTINHVTSFPKWKKVFERVHSHLAPNGVFIFDVNTEAKMERYRTEPPFAEISKNEISVVDVHRVRRFRYEVHLHRMTREQGALFRHHDLRIPEIVVPTPTILRELSKLFRKVTLIDPDRKKPSEETEELFFVCQQPR
jgi:SAM-dependent methyltransferase